MQTGETGENICKNASNKGLISKTYKLLIHLNTKKTNNAIKNWAEDLHSQFSKEDIETANRNIKRHSSLLIIREMHMETTVRHHLILVRMAIIKKSANNKCQRGCGENLDSLLHCWCECRLVQPLWKTVWRFLRKLKLDGEHM